MPDAVDLIALGKFTRIPPLLTIKSQAKETDSRELIGQFHLSLGQLNHRSEHSDR